MHIGFTGTQKGMTPQQMVTVQKIIIDYRDEYGVDLTAHHGDCIGADEEFSRIASAEGAMIEVHPPFNNTKRAFVQHAQFIHPPRPYRKRNFDIVNSSSVIIATPNSVIEKFRGSGTWMTIRIAQHMPNKRLHIVWPDGTYTTSVSRAIPQVGGTPR